MKLTDLLLAELDREVPRSRRALQEVPAGHYDFKPHDKSMIFGAVANMVATMPSWMAMGVTMNELDVAPAGGSAMKQEKLETSEALVKALDASAAAAHQALEGTTDDFLMTPWKLLARGQVVQETPRWEMIQDTLNHWAHHRGQLTVYLRLLGAKVPSIYGPSADDKQFR
jgi:uncharacterized damage-inducible protein DinB